MEIKKVSDCPLSEVVDVWNKGFQDYFVPVHLDSDTFLKRMEKEDLNAEHSVVLQESDELVGILLNGFRVRNGNIMAWNGGTAVVPNWRGKGVSKALMKESLSLYKKRGVKVATLEAIRQNERAIALYKSFGYETIDELILFDGRLRDDIEVEPLHTVSIRPELLPHLTFYDANVPWQCCWESNKTAEAIVYYDKVHRPIGYALFQRVLDENSIQISTVIYQLRLLVDADAQMLQSLLVLIAGETKHVSMLNIFANSIESKLLQEIGIKEKMRQVWMQNVLKE